MQSLGRQPCDLILMDVQMPEMDGLEASRQINKRWHHGERPRIVGLTANAMQGDRELCLAAGMDDYITKPIRVPDLVAALGRTRPLGQKQGGDMSSAPAIDSAVFDSLKANVGDDFIGELIQAYLEDSPKLLAEAKDALAKNDAETFRRATHSLKSNSANFGAHTLAAMSKELEQMGRAGNLAGADVKLAHAESEYERVKDALEGMRK